MTQGIPPLPQKIEGVIFTEIAPNLIPEIDASALVKLGAIVRKKELTKKYEPLTDSLRKIQWVKISGTRAISIEREIAKQREPGAIVFAPSLQIEHTLNITNCVVHAKSALDSMAVFLTELFGLGATAGDRDLKKQKFRTLIAEKEPRLGQLIKKSEPWLTQLQDIRDEWIHKSSLRCIIVQGPSDVGILPIPRKFTLGTEVMKLPLTKQNFWSTDEFVSNYYSNLVALFNAVVESSIQIEGESLSEPISMPSDAEKQLALFPTIVTENMRITKIKVFTG